MPPVLTHADARRIKNDSVANVARAFTNPVRLELLRILCQGEASVTALAVKTGQSPANASAQLKVLLAANAVEAKRRGRSVFYSVGGDLVLRLWDGLHQLAVHAEPEFRELNERYFNPVSLPEDRPEIRPVSGSYVIDVRPADEYALGHRNGARNVPVKNLDTALAKLPTDKVIFIMGRDAFCTESVEAARRIRASGRQAYVVRDVIHT
jgi:DNA-binding transcriptional ArsR family regulator